MSLCSVFLGWSELQLHQVSLDMFISHFALILHCYRFFRTHQPTPLKILCYNTAIVSKQLSNKKCFCTLQTSETSSWTNVQGVPGYFDEGRSWAWADHFDLLLFISSVINQWNKGEMLETESRTDIVDFESITFTLKFDKRSHTRTKLLNTVQRVYYYCTM